MAKPSTPRASQAISNAKRASTSRSLPFDAGATLPQVERWTDRRFQAVARDGLVHAEAEHQLQAVAISHLITPQLARYVFLWPKRVVAVVEGLAEDWVASQTLKDMVHANWAEFTPGHAVDLVQAMREGGWTPKGRPLPEWVRLAMRSYRDEGLTIGQIADIFGFTYWQTSYGFRVPHGKRMAASKVGLVL